MKNAKERFHEVMKVLGLSDYKVYTSIDAISKNMMSKLRQGQTEEVSVKILIPFCEAYPQVNANYILTGNGSMFIDKEQEDGETITESQRTTMYDNMIKVKNEEIEALRNEINMLTRENDRLTGENSVMREQLGMGVRKPQKSA